MDPNKNKFSLYSPKNLKLNSDVEVWVGNAPCILVAEQKVENLLKVY